jgi:hypothetical protein
VKLTVPVSYVSSKSYVRNVWVQVKILQKFGYTRFFGCYLLFTVTITATVCFGFVDFTFVNPKLFFSDLIRLCCSFRVQILIQLWIFHALNYIPHVHRRQTNKFLSENNEFSYETSGRIP